MELLPLFFRPLDQKEKITVFRPIFQNCVAYPFSLNLERLHELLSKFGARVDATNSMHRNLQTTILHIFLPRQHNLLPNAQPLVALKVSRLEQNPSLVVSPRIFQERSVPLPALSRNIVAALWLYQSLHEPQSFATVSAALTPNRQPSVLARPHKTEATRVSTTTIIEKLTELTLEQYPDWQQVVTPTAT